MQQTPQDNIKYHIQTEQPAARQHGSAVSFLLHVPEAASKSLPVSPKMIVRLVGLWLAVFIVSNMVVTNIADKPQISQAAPVTADKMYAQLSNDDKRRANINSLSLYINKYYDRFSGFPAVPQINSMEFRKGDPIFHVSSRRTFMDPLAKDALLAQEPTKGAYFYTPTPVGCNNSEVVCSGYTVGATLDNGQLYTKHN